MYHAIHIAIYIVDLLCIIHLWYYKLLLSLYYNVVVSVLVADQCSLRHKHRGRAYTAAVRDSILHATFST